MTASRRLPTQQDDSLGRSLEVLEGATALLRSASAGDYSYYFAGTLPFLWQLVRFWAQMSLSANAEREVWPGAAWLASCYLWMKVTQALFVQRLLGRLRNAPSSWTPQQLARLGWTTLVLQASALFASLAAAMLLIPAAWTIAFYHHALATTDGRVSGTWACLRAALVQSRRWPRENHGMLALHGAFAFVVFLNVWVLLIFVPQLLHVLFGVETWILALAHSPLNSTLVVAAATIGLALTDPWLKAGYAVRAFRAESVTSGLDLRVAWRRSWMNTLVCIGAGALLLFAPQSGFARSDSKSPTIEQQKPPSSALGLDAQRLDQSLNEVLKRDAFAWRAPRTEDEDDRSDSWLRQWLRTAAETMVAWLRPLGKYISRFLVWLFDLRDPTSSSSSSPIAWGRVLSRGAVVIAILIWGIPIFIALRQWRRRRKARATVAPIASSASNQSGEGFEAATRPAGEWQRQAQQLLAAGDRRQAVRALFLANMAYLFEMGQLVAQAHKTVGDYRRDLERRAHVLPNALAGYCTTARIFESAWYGSHPVTDEVLEQFSRGSAVLRQNA